MATYIPYAYPIVWFEEVGKNGLLKIGTRLILNFHKFSELTALFC